MEEPMSALAVTDRRHPGRKPRAHAGHLWPVPAAEPLARPVDDSAREPDDAQPAAGPVAVTPLASPAPSAAGPAAPAPLTVSITFDGGDPATRERVVAALRDLVASTAASGGLEVHQPAGSLGADVPGPGETPDPVGGAGSAGPGVISLDPRPRTVFRDGWPLHLSRLEYDLLLFLAQHPRQVFSRAQLLSQVWGHTHTTLRTVDVHISRLRTKLDGQELITTVYGLGYRLADDAVVTVAG
jgi:hypothetical protein